MISTYFEAKPYSYLEMAGEEHSMLDGVVQNDWAGHACFISFDFHKLTTMSPSRHNVNWLE